MFEGSIFCLPPDTFAASVHDLKSQGLKNYCISPVHNNISKQYQLEMLSLEAIISTLIEKARQGPPHQYEVIHLCL